MIGFVRQRALELQRAPPPRVDPADAATQAWPVLIECLLLTWTNRRMGSYQSTYQHYFVVMELCVQLTRELAQTSMKCLGCGELCLKNPLWCMSVTQTDAADLCRRHGLLIISFNLDNFII
jgi:hypothetical protein